LRIKQTIYIKFIIAYLIFGFLSFVTIATFTSELTLDYLTQQKAAAIYKEATLISNKYASSFNGNSLTAEDVSEQLKAIDTYMSSSIWIINSDGNVIFNSRGDSNKSLFVKHFNPTDTGNKYYMTGTFYGQFDEDVISVLSPITSNFKVRGYVVIHTPLKNITASRDALLNISYITLGIIFILSTTILIVFTDMVYIPLKKITLATEEYASGNLKYEFSVDKEDEIGYLAASLGYMASELSCSEENQKKFIANVSHDFRSPLTSIKGYLEAMIDDTIPPEMHQKYLKIVLNETKRLTKLTSSLLSLNNLNTKGMLLDTTDFDINKVIKNVTATFEGTCTKKRISFNLVLTGKTLYIKADMVKIQQVLYNLIDNAIKFSHDGSTIKVETTEKNEKVFVSVKDSGIGIPKESLKMIWDRFYKTDLSRGKDKKGTGLGLSITKEIINAHHENINVISTVGVGTEFIFTLPKSKAFES